MTTIFTALLCLGLSLGLRTPVLAGTLSKPSLRAEPGSVVKRGIQVTFSCQGTSGALEYRLHKEGDPYPGHMQTLLEPGNKAKSSIPFLDWSHAGRYRCNYQTPAGWSEFSDPLELVVTGYHYSKPSLSAQYSPAVASGGNIVLQCVSGHRYDRFVLKKEEPQELSWTLTPQYTYSTGQYQALFSVGPVIPSQKWRLRCYGYDLWSPQLWSEPSDPLELQVSETHHKPTIRAEPSSVIASGSHVTIWCQGILNAQEYILQKEGSSAPWDTQIPMEPGDKAKFSISSMTEQYAGRYCCYYYSPAGWTQCSDALELVMTVHSKPQLSALPSPVVTSGENMTLQCVSRHGYGGFTLTREGGQKTSTSQDSQYLASTGQFQALFTVGPVTPSIGGPFRCHGYYKRSPQVWSQLSDPLEIHVSGHLPVTPSLSVQPGHAVTSGASETINPSQNMSDPKTASQSQDHTVENLMRMGMAGLVLMVLGILLWEAQHSQRRTQHDT